MNIDSDVTSTELLFKIIKCIYFNNCEDVDLLGTLDPHREKFLVTDLLQLLDKNKFLVTLIDNYYHIFSSEHMKKLILKSLERDRNYERRYFMILRNVINVLNEAKINYVLIKHYLMKHVKMMDVDLHICDLDEILRACEYLNKLGVIFYNFRLFSHPLKLGMKIPHIDEACEISVEIYPEIAAGRIILGPLCEFVGKAIKTDITFDEDEKVNAYVLPVTENIYTIITHDWYSQHIPLAAVVYFLMNANQCDVDRLLQLGNEYGTLHSIYTFLKISLILDRKMQLDTLAMGIQKTLERINVYGKTLIDHWLEKIERNLEFPIIIPYKFILLSMPFHISKIAKKVNIAKVLYDIYSHFSPVAIYLYNLTKKAFYV